MSDRIEEPVPSTSVPVLEQLGPLLGTFAQHAADEDPVVSPRNRVPSRIAKEAALPQLSPISDCGQTTFPINRVLSIIKADRDINMVQKEALFLIAKATEHFISKLTQASYVECSRWNRRTIQYRDMAKAIQGSEEFFFLEEVIPLPVTLKDAISRRKRKIEEDPALATNAEEIDSNPGEVHIEVEVDDEGPPSEPFDNPLEEEDLNDPQLH